ncbi:chalcone isomerase family protein [Pelobacter seleniigenes]|uniref:chalcone isomerase family protein n=1 Tax=Pelobacter seleniigenes TaxID=407188 RepID=UPI000A06F992|nr:chalcone isomerase family protein [Pelobacter seleniigenes]
MPRFFGALIAGILLSMFALLPGAVAAEKSAEAEFPERAVLDQYELKLSGTAVLTWALLFDVYAGAFYLPDGVSGADWAEDVPKRLDIAYYRSFTAEELVAASDQLLRENLTETDYLSLARRLQPFYRWFRNVEPGDRYSLAYQPRIGTELRLNGQLLGTVPGADFAVAYLGLWLGSEPISEPFRDALLQGSW